MKHALIILILLFCTTLFAKDKSSSDRTDVPESSRYSIIQSPISVAMTFKLDKYTGILYRMLEDNKGAYWMQLRREKHPQDTQDRSEVNYQIFTSGLNAGMIYLLNVNTGATWVLSENSKLGTFFKAVK
jgi:hypothetical protein